MQNKGFFKSFFKQNFIYRIDSKKSFWKIFKVIVFQPIGNGLSIVVLSCPEMQNNFNHLLIGLASFDLLYLVNKILHERPFK